MKREDVNPQELRIGNWIEGCKGGKWKPFQVTASTIKQLVDKEWLSNKNLPDINEYLRPIFLTDKIIEEAGLIGVENEWLQDQVFRGEDHLTNSDVYYYVVDSIENDYGQWQHAVIKIVYVHELQNTYFVSAREELKIMNEGR